LSKFCKALDQRPKTGVVYHCIPGEAVGGVIRASGNYGMRISPEVRQQLGMTAEDQTPLIFASPYITKSMAFGFQGVLQEKIMNSSIEGSDGELVLMCDRDKAMARERNVTIYAVSDENFVTLPYAQRQCVSTKEIPFTKAQIVFQAKNSEDLMRGGVQVLIFRETYAELNAAGVVDEALNNAKSDTNALHKYFGGLIKEGKLIWENQARGINPNPVLAQEMGIELKAPQQAVLKKPTVPKP
jgi:hypothetical protein